MKATYGHRLTRREIDVVRALIAGHTGTEEIATVLGISERTVSKNLNNIFAKVGAHDRTHLALLALNVLEAPPNLRRLELCADTNRIADRALVGAANALMAALDDNALDRLTELFLMRSQKKGGTWTT